MRDLLVHLVAQGATMSSQVSLRSTSAHRVSLAREVIALLRQVQTLVKIVKKELGAILSPFRVKAAHLVFQGATMSSQVSLWSTTAYHVPLVRGVIVLLRQLQTLVRIVKKELGAI